MDLRATIINFCTCRTLQGDRIWTTGFSGNRQSSWEGDKLKRFYSVGSGGLQQLGRVRQVMTSGGNLGREPFGEKG